MTAGLAGDDSESCLCLVASYSKRAELIAKVAAETEQRVNLSPVLGDFLALRYLDLGPEPGQVGDRQRPVRKVAAELRAAAFAAGRNHFALIVIDKSATTIEQVLASCGAEPFIAGFRMRLAGIASNDDRTDSGCHADIVASPNGAWSDPADLVAALHRQCEDLLRYFAARREPGLTLVEIDTLKRAYALADDDDAADSPDDQATGPTDLLDPANPATWPPSSDPPASSEHSPVPPLPAAPTDPGRPAAPAGLVGAVSRLLPGAPWRRGQQSPPSTPLAATTPPDSLGLIYFLTLTEHGMGEDLGQDRLQAVLRDVDKSLAAQPNRAYQVKLLHGSNDKLRGDRQPRHLNRRAVRRSVAVTHFDEVVTSVHASLRRDLAEVGTTATGMGVPVDRSAVVLLTTDPPIADRRSVGAFRELAAEATIIWLVPRKMEGLVNPVFGDRGPAAVLGESDSIADRVCEIVRTGVLPTARNPFGAALAPSPHSTAS